MAAPNGARGASRAVSCRTTHLTGGHLSLVAVPHADERDTERVIGLSGSGRHGGGGEGAQQLEADG
jgi:hypothetical protein